MNPMNRIFVEKVTINMSAGEAGPKLDNYKKIIETITGAKAVITLTHKRTTFGPGDKPIGAKTTLRGADAVELLKRLLQSVENRVKPSQFDKSGNFSFGVPEYINIPGIKYDPDVGIVGMDVCVTLEKPGYRIKKKMIRPSRVGKRQLISKQEAMEFVEKELGANVMEDESE